MGVSPWPNACRNRQSTRASPIPGSGCGTPKPRSRPDRGALDLVLNPAFPFLSTIAASSLGSIFLFAGAMTVVHAFSAGRWRGFFWNGIDLGDWLPGRDQHDNGGLELHRPGAQQAAASHLDKHAASIECKL